MKLALFGATGRVGRAITEHLKTSCPEIQLLVISRSPKNDLLKKWEEDGIEIHCDVFLQKKENILKLLQGVDVVVSATAAIIVQTVWAEAACEAGVRLFIPSEFGPDLRLNDVKRAYQAKLAVEQKLVALHESNPSFQYVFFYCGVILDVLCAYPRYFGISIEHKIWDVYGSQQCRVALTTLASLTRVIKGFILHFQEHRSEIRNLVTFYDFQFPIADVAKQLGEVFDCVLTFKLHKSTYGQELGDRYGNAGEMEDMHSLYLQVIIGTGGAQFSVNQLQQYLTDSSLSPRQSSSGTMFGSLAEAIQKIKEEGNLDWSWHPESERSSKDESEEQRKSQASAGSYGTIQRDY